MNEPVLGDDGKLHDPNCITVQQGELNWTRIIECTWLIGQPCAKESK